MKQTLQISGRECLLYNEGEEPKVLLIQTLGAQERGSIDSEVDMISEATDTSFVMAAFAIGDWDVELTPWHDPAVSKRQAVGEHAGETLRYITDELIPSLLQEYGKLPIVLGGYSLGGLFSLWAGVSFPYGQALSPIVLPPLPPCHPRYGLPDGKTMPASIPSKLTTSISALATARNIPATRPLHKLATTSDGSTST